MKCGDIWMVRGIPDIGNLAERGIPDLVVRVGLAGDVEGVKEVRAELKVLSFCDSECLAGCEVDLLIARRALGVVLSRAKGAGTGCAVRAGAVINASRARGRCGVGAEPVVDRAVPGDQRPIVIGAFGTVVEDAAIRFGDLIVMGKPEKTIASPETFQPQAASSR